MHNKAIKKTALGATNTQSGKEINSQNDSFPHYTSPEPALSTSKPNLRRVAEELAGYGDQAMPIAAAILGVAFGKETQL